ncbi:MAG: GAF domain-containing protein, partial [Candidatus Rokubacteria bacterium]|nr:GAF domain-containing protein [Candidatus Rokubacteria bacterium]
VVPLFAVAVQRSMEEFNTRVQAFIKERFTAIHPVVEWRFRDAAMNHMDRRRIGVGAESDELEPIVFDNVYPLYGLADIRGSSTHRARAIQADLLSQLRLARAAVDVAHRARALPALHQLLYRVDRHAERIAAGLHTGDEVQALAFLRGDVESLFDHLAGFGPDVRAAVEAYRGALDPRLGTVYGGRRRFEDSVTRLNDAVSSYIDLEEQAAQGMFPHYFEKQKTDGVDYQIYIGESLLEHGGFQPLYLHNLRLWQLMLTCGIALRVEQVKPQLPMALDATHLVLVQHAPLAIRFRSDEKRFDVDGAYNIRYEIVKKRIDKALVRGTTERVTQPGRIAIVYSHAAEAQEYRGYIEYLQNLGHLGPDVEDLELEELQGVRGLRALRVSVDLRQPSPNAAAVLAAAIR